MTFAVHEDDDQPDRRRMEGEPQPVPPPLAAAALLPGYVVTSLGRLEPRDFPT